MPLELHTTTDNTVGRFPTCRHGVALLDQRVWIRSRIHRGLELGPVPETKVLNKQACFVSSINDFPLGYKVVMGPEIQAFIKPQKRWGWALYLYIQQYKSAATANPEELPSSH
jgi:hypothetical protein